ncbi:MAG: DUF3618 domain-containing protein [Streptomyces sp.]|uniref:DUF3618 domain-containing protein n=1 Tax=Streptomyces sp. TaxID=1931 RepID=UPI003D6BA177
MTRESGARGAAGSKQLHAEVEEARQQLAETVAELAGRADVAAKAREKAAQARSKAQFKANEAKSRVQHTAELAAHQSFSRPGPAIGAAAAVGAGALLTFAVLHRNHGTHGSHGFYRTHGGRGALRTRGIHRAPRRHRGH